MSEAILSQTLMPLGPEVKPVHDVITNILLPEKEEHAYECAKGSEKPFHSDTIVKDDSIGRPMQYLSLTNRKNASGQGSVGGHNKRITILSFDPSKTAQKTFVCSLCNKSFDTKDLLYTHNMIDHEEDIEVEASSSVSVESKMSGNSCNSDKYVLLTDDDERKYSCSVCDKAFKTRYDVNVHVRIHTGEKPYECPVCGKRTASRVQFSKHMKIHARQADSNTLDGSDVDKYVVLPEDADDKYSCSICDKSFKTRYDVNVHVRAHIGGEPYKCAVCGEKMGSHFHLSKHMMSHATEKSSQACQFRGETFNSVIQGPRPKRTDTAEVENESSGPLCVREEKKKSGRKRAVDFDRFDEKTDADLAELSRIQEGDKPYECIRCNKRFSCKSDIRRHIRVHTGKKPFKCNHCIKTFSNSSNLYTHQRRMHKGPMDEKPDVDLAELSRIQEGDKPYECIHCNKRFSCKSHIRRHIRVHTGKRPFKCNYCIKTFSNSSNLYTHQRRMHKGLMDEKTDVDLGELSRIQEGDKPYECIRCNKRFSCKSHIKRHIRVHTGKRPFKCYHCIKTFSNSSNLYAHQRRMHKLDTNLCHHMRNVHNVSLNMKKVDSFLEKNMKIHSGEKPYECTVCSKRFKVRSYIRHHIRIHLDEKPYKCPMCVKMFNSKACLNRHSVTHSRKKSYHCLLCKENFSRRHFLLSHIKAHKINKETNEDNKTIYSTGEKRHDCHETSHLKMSKNNASAGKNNITVSHSEQLGQKEVNISYASDNDINISSGCDTAKLNRDQLGSARIFTNVSSVGDLSHREVASGQEGVIDNAGDDHLGTKGVEIEPDEKHTSSVLISEARIMQSMDKERPTVPCQVHLIKLEKDSKYVKRQSNKGSNYLFYNCSNCDKAFRSKRILSKHFISTHKTLDLSTHGTREEVVNHLESVNKNCTKENVDNNASSSSFDHTKQESLTPKEKRHKCKICNKAFAFRNSLYPHMLIHTGNKPFKCSFCHKAYISRHNLNNHMRVHTGERPFQCSQCSKAFKTKSELNIHLRTHSGEKPYKCSSSKCDQSFRIHAHLKTHLRKHTGEKPNKCSHCHKSFSRKFDLTIHERIHTGERPYCCSLCSKRFISNSVLHRHKRSHNGEKPYKCLQCDKSYKTSSHLVDHQKKHSEIRPHNCSICLKSFSRKADCTVHMRIHTGEKPFQCWECGKMFYSNSNFHKHKRLHQDQIKRFGCDLCGKKFSARSYLSSHMKIHDKNPLVCAVCGKVVWTSHRLEMHMKTHALVAEKDRQCSECGETCITAIGFYKHLMQVHEFDSDKLAEIAMQS